MNYKLKTYSRSLNRSKHKSFVMASVSMRWNVLDCIPMYSHTNTNLMRIAGTPSSKLKAQSSKLKARIASISDQNLHARKTEP